MQPLGFTKPLTSFLLSVLLLLATSGRLPAPIQEESTPTPEEKTAKPQAAPAKQKSAESSESNSARRFDGTWKGTQTKKQTISSGPAKGDYVYSYSFTLSIKGGRTADLISEATFTLPRGRPFRFKTTNHADNLVAAGSDLIIRWAGGRLIDWEPKTLPLDQAQVYTESETKTAAGVFTLKGNELVGGGGAVYYRVK